MPTVTQADLEGLYRRFGPAIYRRALRLLGDATEAHDVLQETFIAYMKSTEGLRGEAQPFTVLYQISTYQALDRVRRKARWRHVLPNMAEPDETESLPEVATPPSGVAQVEAAQDLALLTRGEDAQTLTAASLYFVEGCTTEETAQVLGLSRKTVGKLLAQFTARAKKRAARLDEGDAS